MVMLPQATWLIFEGASEVPTSGLIRVKRATRKNSQPARPRGLHRKGAGGCVARWSGMNLNTGALPAAHFERTDITIICEKVH